jgi:hypothetical protein
MNEMNAEDMELLKQVAVISKYIPTEAEVAQLDHNFTYHAPVDGQRPRYEAIREEAKQLGALLLLACPPSRERSVALTNLEQVVFWANASIAREV